MERFGTQAVRTRAGITSTDSGTVAFELYFVRSVSGILPVSFRREDRHGVTEIGDTEIGDTEIGDTGIGVLLHQRNDEARWITHLGWSRKRMDRILDSSEHILRDGYLRRVR
jgi:hypothetical protein